MRVILVLAQDCLAERMRHFEHFSHCGCIGVSPRRELVGHLASILGHDNVVCVNEADLLELSAPAVRFGLGSIESLMAEALNDLSQQIMPLEQIIIRQSAEELHLPKTKKSYIKDKGPLKKQFNSHSWQSTKSLRVKR